MNDVVPLSYLEAKEFDISIPFARYLPPSSNGMITAWLSQHAAPGEWVLDPIGATPTCILEAARAGYKVLAAINNPVNAFELKLLARSPSKDEFQSIVSELAIQKKGSDRLETHIQSLYLTRCASCGKDVFATTFFWQRGEPIPYAKTYTCPACGDSGEHPVSDEDIERLAVIQRSDPLHRARALERVPDGTKEAREHLEEILKVYSARPLYALFTLINKVEGLSLSPDRRQLIDALLLSALDAGHNLWDKSNPDDQPRVLNTPSEFVERNLWMVLEEAVDLWVSDQPSIELTVWPACPESNGICLYVGRMRDLVQQKLAVQPKVIFSNPPRPNQAFWTLSTLWSSWLWGKENALSLKNVLERQRFDWYWHANALHSAFAPAARIVEPGTTFFCLINDPVPGFISCVAEACSAGGFVLTGFSYKNETNPVQLEWQTHPAGQEFKKINLQKIVREAIHEVLNEIGEPCRYLKLYTAAIIALTQENAFPKTIQQLTYETVTEVQTEIGKIFSDRKFLARLDSSAQDFDNGFWWLAQDENCQVSLSDRVELELVNMFQKEQSLPAAKIRRLIHQRFNGFLTPPDELLDYCLRSYADFNKQDQTWVLKAHEISAERNKDLREYRTAVLDLAKIFNLESREENPVYWYSKDSPDSPLYRICLSTSAVISRFIKLQVEKPVETVFIFPGSRSALLRYKLDRDPNLREKVAENWHFLKFRTLRQMVNRKDISPDLWNLFIDSDPMSLEEATQLSMFL